MAKTVIVEMEKHLLVISEAVEDKHKDVVRFVQNCYDKLKKEEEAHRTESASNALAGISPDGKKEAAFYERNAYLRRFLYSVLKDTAEDWEHEGDKFYLEKHFKAVNK